MGFPRTQASIHTSTCSLLIAHKFILWFHEYRGSCTGHMGARADYATQGDWMVEFDEHSRQQRMHLGHPESISVMFKYIRRVIVIPIPSPKMTKLW